jgi:preprotein translocase subunit YajC
LNIDFVSRLLFAAAEAAPAAANAADGGGGAANPPPAGGLGGMGIFPLIFMLLIVFYLMVLRPQKKEQKKRLELLNNLKKNDRVVTIGGIYGTVMNAKRESDEVILKIDETNDTKIRVIYSAIARVITDDSSDESKTK